METENHEYYVSLEVAKLLKEAGFDWKQYSFYNSEGILINGTFAANWNDKIWDIDGSKVSAPTLDIAQRWLREVKGYYIEITALENKRCVTNSDGWTFHYEYDKPKFDCDIRDEKCENISTLDDSFNTYEEALEAGIKRALGTILRK